MIKFLAGIILTGVLVFLPAGSFAYWQGRVSDFVIGAAIVGVGASKP